MYTPVQMFAHFSRIYIYIFAQIYYMHVMCICVHFVYVHTLYIYYMYMHLQMFAPFLAADGLTVSEFVHREVEPLDKEVEQARTLARSLAALRFKRGVFLCVGAR